MATNEKVKSTLIYPSLSYSIVGVCFTVHNEIGRYAREKQYSNMIETKLKQISVSYEREYGIGDSGNIVDFLIDDKIILEVKAKRLITKNDYFQLQRYLQESKIRLGLLVNFRRKYLQPKRVLKTK